MGNGGLMYDPELFGKASSQALLAQSLLLNLSGTISEASSIGEEYEGKEEVLEACANLKSLMELFDSLIADILATASQMGISIEDLFNLTLSSSLLGDELSQEDLLIKLKEMQAEEIVALFDNYNLTSDDKAKLQKWIADENDEAVLFFMLKCQKEETLKAKEAEKSDIDGRITALDKMFQTIQGESEINNFIQGAKGFLNANKDDPDAIKGRVFKLAGEEIIFTSYEEGMAFLETVRDNKYKELEELRKQSASLKNEIKNLNKTLDPIKANIEFYDNFRYAYEDENAKDNSITEFIKYSKENGYDFKNCTFEDAFYAVMDYYNDQDNQNKELNLLSLIDMIKENNPKYKDMSNEDFFSEFNIARSYFASITNGNTKLNKINDDLYEFMNSDYFYMNDDEKKAYGIILSQEGEERANYYLKLIESRSLNQRKGIEEGYKVFEDIVSKPGKVLEVLEAFKDGSWSGLAGYCDNICSVVTGDYKMNVNDYKSQTIQSLFQSMIYSFKPVDDNTISTFQDEYGTIKDQEKLNDIRKRISNGENVRYYELFGCLDEEQGGLTEEQVSECAKMFEQIDGGENYTKYILKNAYSAGSSFGNMLPSIALGMVPYLGPTLSKVSFFASAAGGTYREQRREGLSFGDAMLAGVIDGGLELTTEYFVGGIPVLSKNAEGIGDFLKLSLSGKVASLGKEILSEEAEETLQLFAGDYLISKVTGEEYDLKEKFQQLPDTVISTFMSTLAMNSLSYGTQATFLYGKAAVSITNEDWANLYKEGFTPANFKNMLDAKVDASINQPANPINSIKTKLKENGLKANIELNNGKLMVNGVEVTTAEFNQLIKLSNPDSETKNDNDFLNIVKMANNFTAEERTTLDAINPNWRSELTVFEAKDLLENGIKQEVVPIVLPSELTQEEETTTQASVTEPNENEQVQDSSVVESNENIEELSDVETPENKQQANPVTEEQSSRIDEQLERLLEGLEEQTEAKPAVAANENVESLTETETQTNKQQANPVTEEQRVSIDERLESLRETSSEENEQIQTQKAKNVQEVQGQERSQLQSTTDTDNNEEFLTPAEKLAVQRMKAKKPRFIGANFGFGTSKGGLASSYSDLFVDQKVLVADVDYERYPCVIGDVSDAYNMLEQKLQSKRSYTFEEFCEMVFATVQEYFGDYSNISERLSFYSSDEDISNGIAEIGKVSDLKGKNAAMCVERAMLSQNLLMKYGYKSVYKMVPITQNGNDEYHAFNLVEHDGKYYVFDSTIPTMSNDKISPLIAEIPEHVFENISNPANDVGYAIEVSHYNPLKDKDTTIIYDVGREQKYVAEIETERKTDVSQLDGSLEEVSSDNKSENETSTASETIQESSEQANLTTTDTNEITEEAKTRVRELIQEHNLNATSKDINILEQMVDATDDNVRIDLFHTLSNQELQKASISTFETLTAIIKVIDFSNPTLLEEILEYITNEKNKRYTISHYLPAEVAMKYITEIEEQSYREEIIIKLPTDQEKYEALKYLSDEHEILSVLSSMDDDSYKAKGLHLLKNGFNKAELIKRFSDIELKLKYLHSLNRWQINVIVTLPQELRLSEYQKLPVKMQIEELNGRYKSIFTNDEKVKIIEGFNNILDKENGIQQLNLEERKYLVEHSNDNSLIILALTYIDDVSYKENYMKSLSREEQIIILETIQNEEERARIAESLGLTEQDIRNTILDMQKNNTLRYNRNFVSKLRNFILTHCNFIRTIFKNHEGFIDTKYGVYQSVFQRSFTYEVNDPSYIYEHLDEYREFLKTKSIYTDEWFERHLTHIKSGSKASPKIGYALISEFVQSTVNSPEKAKEIIETIFDTKVTVTEEYKRLQTKLKSMGVESEIDQRKILNSIESKDGVCTYAAIINAIFAKFWNNPSKFKQIFGYDMTIDNNGVKNFNTNELLLDMYIFINSNLYRTDGKEFFTFRENGTLSVSKNYENLSEIDNSNQIYLDTYEKGINTAAINAFFKYKNSNITFNSNDMISARKSYNLTGFEDIEKIKEFIFTHISQGDFINISMYKVYNDINFKYLKTDGSNETVALENSHAVFVTGIDDDYVYIASWGKEYKVRLDDFVNNNFKMYAISINETSNTEQANVTELITDVNEKGLESISPRATINDSESTSFYRFDGDSKKYAPRLINDYYGDGGDDFNQALLDEPRISIALKNVPAGYQTIEEIRTFLKTTIVGKWLSSLTPNEIRAIITYSYHGTESIQDYLRKTDTKFYNENGEQISKANMLWRIALIDSAIEKFGGLDRDTILYRGVDVKAFSENVICSKLFEGIDTDNLYKVRAVLKTLVGKKITDLGYMSTSFIYNASLYERPIMLEIEAPKGSKGAYINQISKFYDTEYEFLLAHGSSLEIKSVTLKDTNMGKKLFVKCRLSLDEDVSIYEERIDEIISTNKFVVDEEDRAKLIKMQQSTTVSQRVEIAKSLSSIDAKLAAIYVFPKFKDTLYFLKQESTDVVERVLAQAKNPKIIDLIIKEALPSELQLKYIDMVTDPALKKEIYKSIAIETLESEKSNMTMISDEEIKKMETILGKINKTTIAELNIKLYKLKKVAEDYGMDVKTMGQLKKDETVDDGRMATAKALAHDICERARESEPAITEVLRKYEDASLADIKFEDLVERVNKKEVRNFKVLIGLDHKLKNEERLAAKIYDKSKTSGKSMEQYASEIGDSVRYTLLIDDFNYANIVDETLDGLAAEGYIIDEVSNNWGKQKYQGINVSIITPNGLRFELQFHTLASFYAKEDLTHSYYEIARNEALREKINYDIKGLADAIQVLYQKLVPRPYGILEYNYKGGKNGN